jgi:hypothetical protein
VYLGFEVKEKPAALVGGELFPQARLVAGVRYSDSVAISLLNMSLTS